jgi:hypothetical protein
MTSGSIHVEIRLEGHLDQHWTDWFAGLTLTHEPDGTTALRGALKDQAQLHGVLARVRDLGANLISARLTGNDATRAQRPGTGAPPKPLGASACEPPESPTNAQPGQPPQE